MEISGEQRINAPRMQVWEALNDPAILQACILGCEELEKLSDTEMRSVLASAIARMAQPNNNEKF